MIENIEQYEDAKIRRDILGTITKKSLTEPHYTRAIREFNRLCNDISDFRPKFRRYKIAEAIESKLSWTAECGHEDDLNRLLDRIEEIYRDE